MPRLKVLDNNPPVAGMTALLLTLYWPSDGDYARFAYRFSPSAWSNLMGSDSGGTFNSADNSATTETVSTEVVGG